MKAVSAPTASADGVLLNASFADAFVLTVSDQNLDALSAARRSLGRSPRWIQRLMGLRNIMMKPFGLRTPSPRPGPNPKAVGPFPIISTSPERVVLGFDDRHLDFRVIVDVKDLGAGRQSITTSTLVKTHNTFGRLYMAVVKPFHRVIVPEMLAQAAHSQDGPVIR